MSLKGKRALITGSSRGIGRGIALKLAEHGVKVAVHYYKNKDAATDALAKVRERGVEGIAIQADVARPEDIHRMFDQVKSALGGLDIFVNNARPDLPGFYQRPLEITLEQWHAALDSLVRYFAVALAPRGITVNGISPGGVFGPPNVVEGGVLRVLPQAVQDAIRSWHEGGWTPMGRLGTPADIGNAVMLLCMDEASFITGQILHVDGGTSIMDTVLPLEIQRG